jgi:hypothetical protein
MTIPEQVHLIFANLIGAQPVWRTAEVFHESLNDLDVGSYGILSVVATPEFLQHHLSKTGHRDLLVTHTLRPLRSYKSSGTLYA